MADNNSYVIQIENSSNSHDGQIVISNLEDAAINFDSVQANVSRRTSISSQNSLISQPISNLSICCYSPINYDSGNFSISDINRRPPSLSSADDESFTSAPMSSSNHEKELREKNQFLFLAQQDVRKLKSEVDRLSKSEKWYKNELKIQKRSRLDILEKLYLNERNYFHENQKLQTECAKLYTIIRDVEKKANQDKEHLLKKIKGEQDIANNIADKGTLNSNSIKFEFRKLRGTAQEHEQLIDILRRQKQSLLNDLRNLTAEKDAKIILLEKNVAALDEENRKIVEKCKKIIIEKKEFENEIRQRELSNREIKITSSNIEIIKPNAIMNSLENGKNLEELQNNLIESFLTDSPKKLPEMKNIPTNEIVNTKSHQYLNQQYLHFQDRKIELAELRENIDQQQRDIENLNFKIQEKSFEIENLKSFNLSQSEIISKLQVELVEYKKLSENYENSIKINTDNLNKQDLMIKELQTENKKLNLVVEKNSEIDQENKKLVNTLNVIKQDLDNRSIDLNHSNKEILTLKNIIETQKEEIALILREKNNFVNIQTKYENISRLLDDKNLELFKLNSELVQVKFENNKLLFEKDDLVKMQQEIKRLKLELDNQNCNAQKLITSNNELEEFIKYHKLNYEKEELSKHQVYEQLCGNIKTLQTELQICNLDSEKLKSELLTKNSLLEKLKIIFEQQNQLIHNFNAACLASETDYDNKSNDNKLEFFKPLLNEDGIEWKYFLENFNDTQQIINKTSEILNQKNSEIETLKKLLVRYSEKESSEKNDYQLSIKNVYKLDEELKLKILENEKLKSDIQSQLITLEITNNNIVKLQDNFEKELLKKNQQSDEQSNEIAKLTEELNRVNNNMEYSKREHQNTMHNVQNEFSKKIASHETQIQSLKTDLEFKENEINNLLVEKIKFENDCNEYENKFKIFEIKNLEQDMKIKSLENTCNSQMDYCTNCEKYQTERTDNSEGTNSLNSSPSDLSIADELKQIKLLKNVIEIEHKKKILRYEVHIRTLLANIKRYKKNLEIVENQYGKLLKKYETLESCTTQEEKSKANIAKTLGELTKKYEESVKTINAYKNQLETAQNQLKNIDIYKHLNSNLKGSLTNLMDDYKMLIHQTISLNVNKSNTNVDFSSIYDLIDKSNNYVPNLKCLSESVNDFKCDIDKIKSLNMSNYTNDISTPINLTWPIPPMGKRKSLMDEFKEINIDGKL